MLTHDLIPQQRPGVGKTQLARKLGNMAPSVRTSTSYRNRRREVSAPNAPGVAATDAMPAHSPDGQPGDFSRTRTDGLDCVVPVDRSGFAPPFNSPRAVVIVADWGAPTVGRIDATVIDEFVAAVAAVAPVAPSVRDAPAASDDFWSGAAQEGSVPTRRLVTRPNTRRRPRLVRSARRLRR